MTDEKKWFIREVFRNCLKKKYHEAKLRGADWPENLEEASSETIRNLSSAAKDELLAIPKEELPGICHFGLGRWIRNKFALASYINDALLLSCARSVGKIEEYHGEEYYSIDADDASTIIIVKVWKKLQSKNISNSSMSWSRKRYKLIEDLGCTYAKLFF